MRDLTFGYSPCPNDTFAFHALAHGLVHAPFRITPVLLTSRSSTAGRTTANSISPS